MQGINPITGLCTCSTPCGWCTKWDKQCDKKIGCGESPSVTMHESHARKFINEIKSGKLPPLNTNDTYGLEKRK